MKEALYSGSEELFMISESVKCIPLDELIETYNYSGVNFIQIDTEGYDSEIILNLNFKKIKPQIIHFEHGYRHKHMSEVNLNKVRTYLHDNGYEISFSTYDATAYLPEFIIQDEID
ncbi:MAG: FkbM family methyltransferase [Bacteroidetes bacterium]|nr:FkbM family methyltransferase [Bacteroidota bacterium]